MKEINLYTNYREDVYVHSSAVLHNNGSGLNSYCVEAVCYNNSVNSTTFTPEDCSGGLCVSEQLSPTVPDVGDRHWFFFFALIIGGAIHVILSIFMVAFFFILNYHHLLYHLRRICGIRWCHIKSALYKYVKLHIPVSQKQLTISKCRWIKCIETKHPHDDFTELTPPRYFEDSMLVTFFSFAYVFVSDIIILLCEIRSLLPV